MSIEIKWFGHNAWTIQTSDTTILLDPFFDDSPTAPVKSDAVSADYILVSHGHFDHVGDTAKIATRNSSKVLTNFEIAEWFKKVGVADEMVIPLNLGGSIGLPFGTVKMTIAHHSSVLPDGTYGGNPGGFLLELEGKRIYFACDTALFLDMKLIGVAGLDLAVLPIGDQFTMGPADSLEAIKLLNPKRVAPCHYNTWPPIEQNAEEWAGLVRIHSGADPIVLEPGGVFTL
ncbi:MAG: metal-dependent hydrolase [Mariniblastus sp.]|jgi:L-ascorbate metabolism protein UlaG (beta-lactamase superfamily)|nr:metal-dependent hydrolase [Mariniblastus sp.]